jgi:cation-transporting P-type ATPase E
MEKDKITGLSEAEALNLPKNITTNKYSLKIRHIVFRNTFTFFNILLFIMGGMLIYVNKISDAVFMTYIVILNAGIAIFQEIKAKRTLDKIKLINAAQVTVIRDSLNRRVRYEEVVLEDVVVATSGDQIITDGKIVYAENASVDESILTGESDYVAKKNDDTVTSGSYVITGTIYYRVTAVGNNTYSSKVLAKSTKYSKQKTKLEQQIDRLLLLCIITMVLLAVFTLLSLIFQSFNEGTSIDVEGLIINLATVVSALVPTGLVLVTTLSYAAAAIKSYEYKVLIQKISAVESMAHIDTLCMDKTGTLTTNKIEFVKIVTTEDSDPGSEVLHKIFTYASNVKEVNRTIEALRGINVQHENQKKLQIIKEKPFNSKEKYSAVAFNDNTVTYLGAPEVLVSKFEHKIDQYNPLLQKYFSKGYRCLVIFEKNIQNIEDEQSTFAFDNNASLIGFIILKDEIRHEAKETIQAFKNLHIDLKVISGDNQESVASIAAILGIDKVRAVSGLEMQEMNDPEFAYAALKHNVFGRITPEQKEKIVRVLQKHKKYVGMIGDGVNDILAIKKANLGIAMNAGAQMTKDVSDIILLNNSFSSLPAIFHHGEQIFSNIVKVGCLFITKTIYATALIILLVYLSLDFPFLPKQVTLVSLFTVGIPALFFAMIPSPIIKVKSFIKTVLSYGFSCGVIYTLASLLVFLILYILPPFSEYESLSTARTGIVTMLTFGGLFGAFLVLLNEKITWQNIMRNKINVGMLAGTVIAYLLFLERSSFTKFFEVVNFGVAEWLIILPIFIVASVIFYIERKYNIIFNFLK